MKRDNESKFLLVEERDQAHALITSDQESLTAVKESLVRVDDTQTDAGRVRDEQMPLDTPEPRHRVVTTVPVVVLILCGLMFVNVTHLVRACAAYEWALWGLSAPATR